MHISNCNRYWALKENPIVETLSGVKEESLCTLMNERVTLEKDEERIESTMAANSKNACSIR